jgi:hypothetical protein
MSTSTSPSKRPRNSEMYNKIINLKSKLANFNNNGNSLNSASSNSTLNLKGNESDIINKQTMSKTFIESEPAEIFNSANIINTNTIVNNNTSQPIMSKINELKKKWNEVSNKNKNANNFALSPNLTPDKSSRNDMDDGTVSVLNTITNTQNTEHRLSEIKNKYNINKLKNVNTKK